jgi:hypothetical protein
MDFRGHAPGVHVQRVDAEAAAPVVLRTDIAALVGLAERGPLDLPLPLESWAQYQAHFGDPLPGAFLGEAVRGFFGNGGGRVWVVRVAARQFGEGVQGGAQAAELIVRDIAGRPAWRLAASSPGSWGNELAVSLAPERPLWQRALSVDAHGAVLPGTRGYQVGDLVQLQHAGEAAAARVLVAVDHAARRIAWVAADPRERTPAMRPWLQARPGVPLAVQRVAYRLELQRRGAWLAGWRDVHLPLTHVRGLATLFAPGAASGAARLRLPPPVEVAPPLPAAVWLVAEPLAGALDGVLPLDVSAAALALSGGTDGLAALTVGDFLGAPSSPAMSDAARAVALRGLATLADLEQVALVGMPDLHAAPVPDPDYEPILPPVPGCQPCPPPPEPVQPRQPRGRREQPSGFADSAIARAQAALLADCEARDRFAVLSPPRRHATEAAEGFRALLQWRERLVADLPQRAGGLYGPWLGVPAQPRTGTGLPNAEALLLVPPCGHVLGALAALDLAIGPMRPPANLELQGAVEARRAIDASAHGELNEGGVNVIRRDVGAALGAAPRLMGARTVSDDPDWRYVHVVRIVQALKRAFDLALRWTVFEPNDDTTRTTVAATLEAVLLLFWERGAFAGETPAGSYFVRCDDDLNDAAGRERGELVALVGIAPVAPAEFIVLRVGRQGNLPRITLAAEAMEAAP